MNAENVFLLEAAIDAKTILLKALDAELETVVLVGRDVEGRLYVSGSGDRIGDCYWLLGRGKRCLLEMVDGEE